MVMTPPPVGEVAFILDTVVFFFLQTMESGGIFRLFGSFDFNFES